VPCIVSWPQRLTGDRHTDAVVSNIDLAPTILQACGVALPAGWHLDGHSWMPLLQGQTDTVNEAVFLEIGWTRAVVTQRWKYLALRYPPDVQELIAATREKVYHMRPLAPLQHHALLRHPNFYDPDQLYDLRDDRAETANLAYDQERAADLAGLRERMSTWLRTFEEHPFGEFTA
jgi:arylsulfatase A-like enzyme